MIAVAVLALFASAGVCDLHSKRIPNAITYTLIGGGLVHGVVEGTATTRSLGALLCAAIPLLIAAALMNVRPWSSRSVLGGGDIKAFAAIGMWFGVGGVVVVGSALVCAVVVQAVRSLLRPGSGSGIVLGPYLALAVTAAAVVVR